MFNKSLENYMDEDKDDAYDIMKSKRALKRRYLEHVTDNLDVNSNDVEDKEEKKRNPQSSIAKPLDDMMGNPFVNFLREYRLFFDYSGHEEVQQATRHWHSMPISRRRLYSPEVYRSRYGKLSDNSDSDDESSYSNASTDFDLSNDSDSEMDISDDESGTMKKKASKRRNLFCSRTPSKCDTKKKASKRRNLFCSRTPSKGKGPNQGNSCPEDKKKPVCKSKRKPASCKSKRKKRGRKAKPKPKLRNPKRKMRACKPKPKKPSSSKVSL